MRKVILSVISTLVVIGVIFLVGVLYMRGQGFSAREEPTWMEQIMARNACKIATPPDAKNAIKELQMNHTDSIKPLSNESTPRRPGAPRLLDS